MSFDKCKYPCVRYTVKMYIISILKIYSPLTFLVSYLSLLQANTDLCHSRLDLSFLGFHLNGIMPPALFWLWLPWHSITLLKLCVSVYCYITIYCRHISKCWSIYLLIDICGFFLAFVLL